MLKIKSIFILSSLLLISNSSYASIVEKIFDLIVDSPKGDSEKFIRNYERNTEKEKAQYDKKVAKFQKNWNSYSDEEKTQHWLNLAKVFCETDNYSIRGNSLLELLPAPSTWMKLESGFVKHIQKPKRSTFSNSRYYGLKMYVHHLNENKEAMLEAFRNLSKSSNSFSSSQYDLLISLQHDLSKEELFNYLKKSLSREHYSFPDLKLIELFGKDKASELIIISLKNNNSSLRIDKNPKLQSLAKRLCKTHLKQLKSPQWGLVDNSGTETVSYEEMLARFSNDKKNNQYEQKRAAMAYSIHLASIGEFKKSIDFMPESQSYVNKRLSAKLNAIEPNDEFYLYIKQAYVKSNNHQFLHLYLSYLSKGKYAGQKSSQTDLLSQSYEMLAQNNVNEAMKFMSLTLKNTKTSTKLKEPFAQKLLILSYLFKEATYRKDVFDFLSKQDLDTYSFQNYIKTLKRFEASGEDWNKMALILEKKLDSFDKNNGWKRDNYQWQLATVYSLSNQYDKSLNFINNCSWDKSDLEKYVNTEVCSIPVVFIVAEGLIKTGETEKGLELLEKGLYVCDTYDPAYKLLLNHSKDPLKVLTQLFEYNPFEERPLIWKAKLLIESGKFNEAEKLITQAISIDPSDGEMGSGDRMRVYAVLAEIKDKQGLTKDKEFLDGVIRAIRQSEEADLYYQAGLIAQALDMYIASLNHFADAYCIQSRTALRLSQSGQHKEAEPYFRRAFQLMPDSFGRIESHCFGCEGIFSSEQAAKIAQEVFSKLLKESPEKPQLHYLMGYLLESQDKLDEAVLHYKKAVSLDELYVNAWKKLISAYDKLDKNDELHKTFSAFLKLNLPGYKVNVNYFKSFTPKQIWDIIELQKKKSTKTISPLYSLKLNKKSSNIHFSSSRDELRKMHPGMAISRAHGYRSVLQAY